MSVTPEVETDGGFDQCPNCYSEIDTWSVEKRGMRRAEARIIALLETRLDDCYEKNDMGGWSFSPSLFAALIKGENA